MPADKQSCEEIAAAATALERTGLLMEALASWRRAVSCVSSPGYLFRLGRVATKLGLWKEAECSLLAALTAAPNWGLAHVALGRVYRSTGAHEKARDSLRQAVTHGVREAWTLSLLADALIRLGQLQDAEEVLKEALAVDPRYEEAYFLMAQARAGDPKSSADELVPLYLQAIALDPEYSLAHRELGWLLRGLDQIQEAEKHVRRAIELDPADEWSFIYLGNILWGRGDLPGAAGAFEKAIELDPSGSTGYWCLADLRRAEGDMPEAKRLLRQSLAHQVDSAPANLRFALLLWDLGQRRKAKKYLRRVLHFAPENAVARRLLDQGDAPSG